MTTHETGTACAARVEEFVRSRQAAIEEEIKRLVELESPSDDEEGSRAVVNQLATTARNIEIVDTVECVDVPGVGQHLLIRAFTNNDKSGQVMCVGHTDTVHPRGSIDKRPWRRDQNLIYGPGVFDMKANCITALEVLRAFGELSIHPERSITVALTCDEEVGSMAGWPFLESVARARSTRCALVLEPPAPGGKVKTSRKGTGMFEIRVEGKAAHAGLEPENGASAVLELARQIERLHAINSSGSGITINVGVIRGGTRSNVVPAEAEGEIDVRFSTEAEARDIERILHNVESIDERTKVFISGAINRPPLERTNEVVHLFETARQIAASLGFELGETQVGGASDGNFLASIGIPVLDGLGVCGDGAHATHEHIDALDIPRRVGLLAGLIMQV